MSHYRAPPLAYPPSGPSSLPPQQPQQQQQQNPAPPVYYNPSQPVMSNNLAANVPPPTFATQSPFVGHLQQQQPPLTYASNYNPQPAQCNPQALPPVAPAAAPPSISNGPIKPTSMAPMAARPPLVQYQQPQPQQQQPQHNHQVNQLANQMNTMSVNQSWGQMWQNDTVNLMAEKDIRTKAIHEQRQKEETKKSQFSSRDMTIDDGILRCTLKKIPDSSNLLQKCRLPLGVVLHPFKDDPNIPVVQESPIVRCRSCRTYINPFVKILDHRRWQCNLCHRVNDVPDEFVYDYRTRQPVDMQARPELNYSSIEFIASVEYMVRPPQPATYLFVFECSASAVQLGYIRRFASALLETLDEIPGDARALIGFIAFDTKLHFFNLNEERPHHMIMPDIEDIFIPHADGLLVKLKSRRKQIVDFLTNILPKFPFDSAVSAACMGSMPVDQEAALGPALQVAFKLMQASGGRITLIQTSLPSAGNRAEGMVLANREDPNMRSASSTNSAQALTPLLNPSTDFYKKLALECSEQQIAVDLFNLSSGYSDLASVGAIARYSGGNVHFYGGGGAPSSPHASAHMLDRFEEDMRHYLARSIGFEAVMRVRSTKGVTIHTFHGNFFVRSTDLIALPNVNADSSYGIQMTITDDLKDFSQAGIQAALLYTTPNGERRIRVHTISLPIVTIVADVLANADHEAILSLLAKMAVDRSVASSIQDAREALINANVDIINTYRLVNSSNYAGLFTSMACRLLPLYSLALLKHSAFRLGISTRIDERVNAMGKMKSLPVSALMLYIYPNLYPIHVPLDAHNPPLPLHLSFANIDRNGVYLLDTYDHLFIYIGKMVTPQFLVDVFNVTQWTSIPDEGDQSSTALQTDLGSGGLGGRTFSMNRNMQLPPPPSMMNGMPNGTGVTADQDSPQQHSNGDDVDDEDEDDEDSLDDSKDQVKKPIKSKVITLPVLDNVTSKELHRFIAKLIADRPFKPSFHILREDSRLRYSFLQYMYDDRNESAFSYYEFLQHLQQNLDK